QTDSPLGGQSEDGYRSVGHTHFWERALLSRRQFMMKAAGASGAVLSSGLWMPALALAHGVAPKPIPGGTQVPGIGFFHIFLPGPDNEPSTITDFKGSIGIAALGGTGTWIDTATGQHHSLLFDVDL